MQEKKNYTIIIPDAHHGDRLDQVLAKLMPDYSRTQLQDWLKEGSILLNHQPVKANLRVKGGEVITANIVFTQQVQDIPQAIPLPIVYEDEAILLINKPAGMVVHPGTGNRDNTLLNALLHHQPSLNMLPRAGILHRLDKDTSGLLLIAKTLPALKNLTQQLKKRSLRREYQTIVNGRLISGGEVDAPIGRHPLQRKKMAVTESGKPAITHYRIAEKYRHHTRLRVRLETGRTHQIRVHMAHIRHPIIGDKTYGGRLQIAKESTEVLIETLRNFKRQALHAFALGIIHPTTKQPMEWEIKLPDDMLELISALNNDSAGRL